MENIQDVAYRVFNTTDGKYLLTSLMNDFVFTSTHTMNISAIDMAYATGKADLVKLLYLIANSKK